MTGVVSRLWSTYRMRLKRRRLLFRAIRSRRQLTCVADRTGQIKPGQILCFTTLRNEAQRLPYFLSHYRKLGVKHFLMVVNDSDDGSAEYLASQSDVSLWRTGASYKASRFGVDWLTWLQMRYGHGHWCLTADADELLLIPHMPNRDLHQLTNWLDAHGHPAFGAMMLDMYPAGPLSQAKCPPGQDPAQVLNWFDADNYGWEYLPQYGHISIRGGVRKRLFFKDNPDHAPHLHKIPLVHWNRRYAYVSSTHLLLPRRLNRAFDARLGVPRGVFLHTKFLDIVIDKSAEEKERGEHFTHADRYDRYYDRLVADPVLWGPESVNYEGPAQLERLGLIDRGRWD